MGMIGKVRSKLGIPTRANNSNSGPASPSSPAGPASTTATGAVAVLEERSDAEATLTRDDAERAAGTATNTATNDGAAAGPKKNWFQRRQEARNLEGSFEDYPHLLAMKPKEKYVFCSDYFEIDSSVACLLAFFHDDASHDNFASFWGIDRIPDGLDDQVTAVVVEQVVRKDDKWVDSFVNRSEQLDRLDQNEQDASGTTSSRRKSQKISGDLELVITELQNGATYLNVHNRLFLKAPSLEILEDSIDRVARLYIDRFGTIKVAPYAGEQRQELSSLWATNEKKRGKGFGFTSIELAGSYSLVTNGLNDRGGEYVGYMVGDVNSSAVLMDVNDYEHHVVIADSAISKHLERAHVSDMWCSKISQAALLGSGRVVHLVLNGADLDRLGPRFDGITSRVDLNAGDVNMFEMFGDEEDELAVFATQMRKLVLMFEQIYEATDSDRSIIRGELEKTATQFYVDQRMWLRNAKEQRHRLRVVNIPHGDVPRLQTFVSYLDTEHKALLRSTARDNEALHAYGVLKVVAKNMLDNNGDLFNNHTANAVDGIRDARRVVYDFSKLMRRGKGVAMAQLVNIVGFAVGKLAEGDSVIIHGAENIDEGVKDYIEMQLAHLHGRGGRVVYSYDDVDKMLADTAFNKFDTADYTLFGPMRNKTVDIYQEQLATRIPPDLGNLIKMRGEGLSYLRRGVTNVVFHLDLALGINPAREAKRRQLHQEVLKAEQAAVLEALMHEDLSPGANVTSSRKHGPGAPGQTSTQKPSQSDGQPQTPPRRKRPQKKSLSAKGTSTASHAGIRKLARR
jgi:hypothetical protein